MMLRFIFATILVTQLFSAKPTQAPVVPPDLEIAYLRAMMDNTIAQKHAADTLGRMQEITGKVIAACGAKHSPQDQGVRIVCVPKAK